MNEDSNPPPWPWGGGRSLRTVVQLWMQGFLDFDESFDSYITTTLTLFLCNTTPSSVSLFPIPLALNYRTLNVPICSADGAGVFEAE